MLLEFTVANFRSFREAVTLSLVADERVAEGDGEASTVQPTPHGDVLRVAGVYGANASGKSNLIRALGVLRSLIVHSARGQAGDSLPAEPFRLDPATRSEPTELEVVFALGDEQVRYGVAFTAEAVVREWLFVAGPDGKEALGFERSGDAYDAGPAWERDEALEKRTRREALHLSVAAAFNRPRALAMVGWMRRLRVFDGRRETDGTGETVQLLESERHRDAIVELVRRIDLGIEGLILRDLAVPEPPASGVPEEFAPFLRMAHALAKKARLKEIVTLHADPAGGPPTPFQLADESSGTQKVIALAGPVVDALLTGSTLVVDELDARLHTLLGMELVRLFQSPETNPRGAQLVFASHDTNLLTRALLRPDQLWFVEKSRTTQASTLYSLAEFRIPEEARGRYETDYLPGRYGAVPFFGNLEQLLGAHVAAEPGPEEG